MSELYHRVLLWHKLVCQTTGGLALCSAKHRLNRDEAQGWIEYLRNVADDIQAILDGAAPVLDGKGRRMLGSGTATDGDRHRFFDKGGVHEVASKPSGKTQASQGTSTLVKEAEAAVRKGSGPRVATRKRT